MGQQLRHAVRLLSAATRLQVELFAELFEVGGRKQTQHRFQVVQVRGTAQEKLVLIRTSRDAHISKKNLLRSWALIFLVDLGTTKAQPKFNLAIRPVTKMFYHNLESNPAVKQLNLALSHCTKLRIICIKPHQNS